MSVQFPTASHTFTVLPAKQNVIVNNNTVPVAIKDRTAIATGVSVAMKDQGAAFVSQQGALIFSAMFLASTFKDAPITTGCYLRDEAQVDGDGNPIYYLVKEATPNALVLKMHLARTEVK